ncbi:MAG: TonB-dependent receptor plug domain-containing protein [Bacteroidales bacterium]|nr:TonB-dependent receptor plug domain-containing protein [Bacteroidales bacterium]
MKIKIQSYNSFSLITLLMFVWLAIPANAQEKLPLTGIVRNSSTGEPLTGASVYSLTDKKNTATDDMGRWKLTLSPGWQTLITTHLGFQTDTLRFEHHSERPISILLKPITVKISDIEVRGHTQALRINNPTPGMVTIPAGEFRKIPSLLGESDPLNALRSLPGIQSVGEGSGYLHIRGGSADQNLILLDGAVLYNPTHLLGLFSTFNSSIVDSVSVFKGSIPAQYGGRLASVINIYTQDGDFRKFGGEVSAGLVSSRIMVEGPVVKDKLSFQIAARRTLLDLLANALIPDSSEFAGSTYFFEDFNARLSWRVNPRNRISLSGYYGDDHFKLSDTGFRFYTDMKWSNRSVSALWDYQIRPGLTLNSGITWSGYHFAFDMTQNVYHMNIVNGISQLRMFSSAVFTPTKDLKIRAGAEAVLYRFDPVVTQAQGAYNEVEMRDPYALRSREYALFAEATWNPKVVLLPQISLGIRTFRFNQVGPFISYIGKGNNPRSDSLVYDNGERIASWNGLEPRLAVTLSPFEHHQVKFAASFQYQPVHMVPFSQASLPIDLWVSSTSALPPQRGTSLSLGWYTDDDDKGWDAYIEGFWRILDQQVELKSDIRFLDYIKGNFDKQFTMGTGETYGFEFMLRKSSGRNRGWIGYTWSKAIRYFPELNNGKPFYARHDRRHDFNLVYQRTMKKEWLMAVQFVYATGQPGIIPEGLYFFGGNAINSYTGMSSYRFPAYHRMDISFTRNPPAGPREKPDKLQSTWSFGVYNLYNRLNPFLIYYDAKWDSETNLYTARSRQISLLPLVPFVTWTGRF